MQASDGTADADGTAPSSDERDPEELLAELAVLEDENRRLRDSYVRAQSTRYRRTALGFAGLGLLATLGAVLFPTLRTLLLALGATGLFTALLIYYITPERFVSAGVGRAVHAALATNHEAVVRELGLGGDPRYVPLGEAGADVRLFVSREAGTPVPPAEELRSLFVVSDEADHRGVAFDPTGAALFEEFERALAGSLEDSLPALADQLRDALVEQFEIVDRIDFEAGEAGRLVVDVRGSAYGPIDRFDDPVTSFVGVGLAKATERPITLRSVDPDAGVVEFRWDHAGTTREPNPDA